MSLFNLKTQHKPFTSEVFCFPESLTRVQQGEEYRSNNKAYFYFPPLPFEMFNVTWKIFPLATDNILDTKQRFGCNDTLKDLILSYSRTDCVESSMENLKCMFIVSKCDIQEQYFAYYLVMFNQKITFLVISCCLPLKEERFGLPGLWFFICGWTIL